MSSSDWSFAALITALLCLAFVSGEHSWEFVDVKLETVYLSLDGSEIGREAGLPDWGTPHPTKYYEGDGWVTAYTITNSDLTNCRDCSIILLSQHTSYLLSGGEALTFPSSNY